jgi:hypothetical protein
MSLVTRGSKVSPDMTRCMLAPQTNALAGEDLEAGACVYLKAADAKLYKTDGTAKDEKAQFWGITPKAYKSGESCTALGIGAKLQYDEAGGLTVGGYYYLATTAGQLDTAPTTGSTAPVARAVSTKDIEIIVQGTLKAA